MCCQTFDLQISVPILRVASIRFLSEQSYLNVIRSYMSVFDLLFPMAVIPKCL